MLQIDKLNVRFHGRQGTVQAVRDASLHLDRGEVLGLVGESGSGKSVTALSIMQLLPGIAEVSGVIRYTPDLAGSETDLLQIKGPALHKIRGSEIGMIFQEPMSALNPVMRCGVQITEAVRLHRQLSMAEAKTEARALLEKVRITDLDRTMHAYPHELSGGQKQRVLIAIALAGNPSILLADEPTTALDVTVQKSILQLLRELRATENLSMVFISHDLGVIQEVADRVAVMYQGEIVETGPVEQILQAPQHPYTRGLIACRPSLERRVLRLPTIEDYLSDPEFEAETVTPEITQKKRSRLYAPSPILEVKDVTVQYSVRQYFWNTADRWSTAVDNVSFEVYPGEIFGLAGESGCGKTTLGRVISQLLAPKAGQIRYRQLELNTLPPEEFTPVRREIQMVFQDPYSALNPRMTVGEALMEPLEAYELLASARQRKERVAELLIKVGLEPDHAGLYPSAFSGGQRQRICLARALALYPKLLICDEVVSALDVSVQAAVLNLLLDLQEEFGLTYIFISHDLSVIKQMCDRVMIMRNGSLEALGYPETELGNPSSPYVRQLIEAIPGQIGS
ncbi:MAG: ABC transporter ATP-binding protein [Bacteroidetes bacterium]|nr:MAG: ABC transporter ATP-binding protein [Bacteroidota bacterium]